MTTVFANRTFRSLFLAQVVALIGTGMLTVALGLLAYDLAGDRAGAVLGTALAIKMIAYVVIAPVAAAFLQHIPRRGLLVSLDVIRAAVALLLPFVTDVWQIYVLIFLLQSASAAFTPTFQAVIPDVLPEEREYTKALALSRLAYDLEAVLSPLFAAALLTLVSFNNLFLGTVFGFLASAAMILSVSLSTPDAQDSDESALRRALRGSRIYFATPRLRGLLAVDMVVAMAGALVLVNTVVYVQGTFGRSETDTALALASFGAGSMVVALVIVRVLDAISDRTVMLVGSAVLALAAISAAWLPNFAALLVVWAIIGGGYSLAQTPNGRLVRRSSSEADRPSLFAAEFSLSHACWLISYPLAGWAGAALGLRPTSVILGLLAGIALGVAFVVWPAHDPEVVPHDHADLPADHPHLREHAQSGWHAHQFVIDDLHRRWPQSI